MIKYKTSYKAILYTTEYSQQFIIINRAQTLKIMNHYVLYTCKISYCTSTILQFKNASKDEVHEKSLSELCIIK